MHATQEQLDRCAYLKEPHAFFMTGDDYLLVSTLSSAAGTLLIGFRFLTLDGVIMAGERTHSVSGSRTTPDTSRIALGEGWLLNLTIATDSDNGLLGANFIRVDVTRGISAVSRVIATLLQGSANDENRLVWPGSPIRSSLENPGRLRSITGTNPAAGAEIIETVPTGARWRVIAGSFRFVTDATVSSRQPRLTITDGTNTIWAGEEAANVTASDDVRHNFGLGTERLAHLGDDRQYPFPTEMVLGAGFAIQTATLNLQAGDNFSALQFLVEEWLEGS
jgi:hypothetical protein